MAGRHSEFAERLSRACDGAQVPPLNYGRLVWIRDRLHEDFNQDVTVETVRKWLAGLALPRREKLNSLAQLLGVNEGWLYAGASGLSEQGSGFDHGSQDATTDDAGSLFLDRIRQRLGGTVTILPGVDLTAPIGEIWDAECG